MAFYADHLLPRGVALCMGTKKFAQHRGPALAALSGRVLELGFGAGHNLAHYPDTVTEILALEPAVVNRRLARRRVERSGIPVQWMGLRGEEIPLGDASVDAVASTWTLCTIPDVVAALAEVRRVLRPGGALHFLEHGLSPDPKVAKWQRRLNGLSKVCAGGCHLDREIDALIREAGFDVRNLTHPILDGPKIGGYLYRGRAVPNKSAGLR